MQQTDVECQKLKTNDPNLEIRRPSKEEYLKQCVARDKKLTEEIHNNSLKSEINRAINTPLTYSCVKKPECISSRLIAEKSPLSPFTTIYLDSSDDEDEDEDGFIIVQ
jgi:hypothetical protein